MHTKQRRSIRRPGENETDSDLKRKQAPPTSIADVERAVDPRKENTAPITLGKEVETKKGSYMIIREIAKGRMARIYEVKRSKDARKLALKVHLSVEPGKPQQLRHEVHIYNELHILTKNVPDKENIRFLDVIDYGESPDGQFLFMTLGGESLASLMSEEKVPDYQSALDISLQMLAAIEQLQSLGFVHCRIRPTAFITGYKSRERYSLYITSFGVARMANPTRPETALPKTPPQTFDRHAPRAQHIGYTYNRRDDYESWFYISADLFHPQFLPWNSEKRLKSMQIADLKEKLMRGDLHFRYSVLPKPFQAIAGAIFETDAKIPNTTFFRECLMTEAKEKGCTLGAPWDYRPAADLLPVPEQVTQSRVEFEFNQCLKATSAFNFGNEKSRTVVSESKETCVSEKSGIQIIMPGGSNYGTKTPPKSSNSKSKTKSPSKRSSTSAKKEKRESKKEKPKKEDKSEASIEKISDSPQVSESTAQDQNVITPQNKFGTPPTQSPMNVGGKTPTPTPAGTPKPELPQSNQSSSSSDEETKQQPKSGTSEETSDGTTEESVAPELSALSASTATSSGLTPSASTTTASSAFTITSSSPNPAIVPESPESPTQKPGKKNSNNDKCPSNYGTGWASTIPPSKKQQSPSAETVVTTKEIEKTPSCYGTGWNVPTAFNKNKRAASPSTGSPTATTTTASTARPPSDRQDPRAPSKKASKTVSKKVSKSKKVSRKSKKNKKK
uniref:Protein kinase domain-containing protein n=1 Tax=Panagrellus redivivus TaxID=6233 RepID=A0A7E4VCR5_PANRE